MKRRERVRRFTRSLARSLDAAHARRTRRTRGTRTHRRAHAGCEQSAATTMMTPKRPQTSPGSVLSLRGGANAPGSPAAAAIVARVDDGVMVYKDLAALPRDKAILDIERPDLMTYELHYSYSPLGVARSPSPGSSFSPPTSPESRMWLEKSSPAGSSPASAGRKRNGGDATPSSHAQNTQAPKILQHFHRPDNGSNIYKKPPIYRRGASSSALPAGKHLEDLIIESSKFPAAEPPDPNAPSKIETEHWPCPPSSAVFEKEKACRRSEGRREEEEEREEEESTWGLRALHRQELNKIRSNIGRIILKEELEKSAAPLRRKTRSLPDRSQHAGAATSRALCFPASSGAGLARVIAVDRIQPGREACSRCSGRVRLHLCAVCRPCCGDVCVRLCVRTETAPWTEAARCPVCWSTRFTRMRRSWSTTEDGIKFLPASTGRNWRDICHGKNSPACLP
ncbi:dematin-like isoform X3 [Hippocampus zosterae]|uniref:dematin-like isoform X3 n=1 Tax=Hippocampus zosterae TaxID=109293 RepID=UPI00223CEC8C|nr:dematin-like isoform X3 [Hippocampus zosterae]